MRLLIHMMVICLLIICCSCSSKPEPKTMQITSKLETALGNTSFSLLTHAEQISAFQIAPTLPGPKVPQYQPISTSVILSEDISKELRQTLLNDSSYHFDITKKCLFIPTFALIFSKDNNSLFIYVSPSCQQLKFFNDNKTLTLDYDPAQPLLEKIFNNIHF